ncbi:MAG: FtsX-like permease family protein [Lachnospiraceae bacterium]|nr:FtsX-like permease family protein [bacterium]MDY5517716.1 FtsX-like permease family protein [Lachnospiraceae bacterium]
MLHVNNKKAIRKLSVRLLKNSKTRNIIAVIAIILTTVLFTSVFSIGMSAIDSMQQATMRQVGTRAHGGFKFLTWQQYEKLLEDPKIKDISYNIIIGFAENEALNKTYTEIRYTEEKSAKWGFCEPTTGTLPVNKMDVATSTAVLDALGLPHELGVQVPLEFTANGKKYRETFTLCGFWEQDSVAMANEAFLSREYCDEVAPVWQSGDVIDFDVANFSGSVNPSYFFSNSWDLEKQVQELKERCGFDASVNEGVNWAYASATVDAGTIVLLTGVLLVIMLSGYLIIYNIFYISVSNEIRYYGLLKTIGTTNRQLRRIVRRQALLLSLVGIPAGLLLGYLCSMWIVPVMMRVSAFRDDFVVSANPVVFVGSAVFTLLTVWVSCIRPCRFVSRISPVEAVRYTEQTNAGKKKSRKSKKVHPLSMAYANIRRTPKKTVAVILSLSLSLILLNGTVTIVSGFDMDKYIKESIVSDFYMTDAAMTNPMHTVEVTDGVSPELVETVGKLAGVTDSGCVYMKEYEHKPDEPALARAKNLLEEYKDLIQYPEIIEQSTQRLDEGWMASHLYGIDPFIIDKMELAEGHIDPEKFATGDYVIATTFVDTGEGKFYDIGDKVPIDFGNGNLKEYEVMALGDIPYALSPQHSHMFDVYFTLPADEFVRQTENPGAMKLAFDVAPDRYDEVEQWVQDYCESVDPNMDYRSKSTYTEEFKKTQQMFLMVGCSMSAILALIGILNFINAVITSIQTRRREFAVLQSVGMTGKQLRLMLIGEGLCYIGGTALFTLTLGSLLGYVLIYEIANQIWFFTYHFVIAPVLFVLPVLFILAVFIPSVCYWQMNKQSVVERLREAEN